MVIHKKFLQKSNLDKIKYLKTVTKAFQRRFRQELINGIIDQECLIISKNLTRNVEINFLEILKFSNKLIMPDK